MLNTHRWLFRWLHTQHDYDKIMTMATGYTLPVLVGGKLDNGEWSWEDGSYFDLDFVTSHSWDQLGSGAPGSRAQEDQMVYHLHEMVYHLHLTRCCGRFFVQVDTLSIHLPSNASVHLSYTVRICRTAKL